MTDREKEIQATLKDLNAQIPQINWMIDFYGKEDK